MRIKRPGFLLLALLAFVLQGCLGFGGPATKSIGTNPGGNQVNVVENVFKGKIYATIGRNLYVITGDGQARQIVGGGNIYDPAVSPDGTKIAFIQRYKQYSNLLYVAASGGQPHLLLNGNGGFFKNDGGFVHNTYHWFFEPAWSPDGSTLLFLSDWMKLDYTHQCTGQDADMLDMQVFSIPLNNPAKIQAVAYAAFGGGGDRDASYRPGHADQIVYTHYADISGNGAKQIVQLYLADPGELARHPSLYCAGGRDSGIAITAAGDQDIQPAFSPDGNALAYVRSEGAAQSSIYVMPVPENVTRTPNDPNTEKLALQPYNRSTRLISGTYVSRPIWSPDGKQLAYLEESNQALDLWVVNISKNAQTGVYSVQGAPTQVITGGVDGDSRAVWTG
jgi:Tol biopolymer transport system component